MSTIWFGIKLAFGLAIGALGLFVAYILLAIAWQLLAHVLPIPIPEAWEKWRPK